MTQDPKNTSSDLHSLQKKSDNPQRTLQHGFWSLLSNGHTLIPLASGVLQIIIGLTLVSITILGLITPLWISAVLSLLGSMSCMMGAFLMYHVISSQGTFETLINKAIRRAIKSQN